MGLISNPGPAPAKAADMGSSDTELSIALLTEVAPAITADREKLNAIRTALQNAGLMA